jgi:hypothetical protein
MLKAEKFRISDKPYAVDLSSLRVTWTDRQSGLVRGDIDAVWFRRRRAGYNGPLRTVACAGVLWDFQRPEGSAPLDQPEPVVPDALAFLTAHDDGRYGGDCKARWDGTNLWSLEDEADRERYRKILVPMLAAYPAVPPGYSGWWVFPR